MASSTFLRRAVRPGSFEFAWLCGSTCFVALVAVAVIVYAAASKSGFRWVPTDKAEAYYAETQPARGEQCENLETHLPTMEPQNSWSNLAYLLVGLLVLCRCPHKTGKVFGVYLMLLCVSSGLYHASLKPTWQLLDIAALNAVLFSLIFFAVHVVANRFARDAYEATLGQLRLPILPALFVLLAPGVMGYLVALHRTEISLFESTTAFIICVGALLSLVLTCFVVIYSCNENLQRHSSVINDLHPDGFTAAPAPHIGRPNLGFFQRVRYWTGEAWSYLLHNLWGSMLLILLVASVAFFLRLNDGNGKPLCAPNAWVQAHALWHIFSAVTLLLGYDLFARLSREPARLVTKSHSDFR